MGISPFREGCQAGFVCLPVSGNRERAKLNGPDLAAGAGAMEGKEPASGRRFVAQVRPDGYGDGVVAPGSAPGTAHRGRGPGLLKPLA